MTIGRRTVVAGIGAAIAAPYDLARAQGARSGTLRIALLGDARGPLGRALAQVGTVRGYDRSSPPESTDMLIVDNASAPGGAPDGATIAALMDAGAAVGCVNATAQQRADLSRACGLSPAADTPFFIASRRRGPAGRPQHRAGIVGPPARAPDGLLTCDESGKKTTTPIAAPAPDPDALAKSIAEVVGGHFNSIDVSGAGLVPPGGATYAGPIAVTCAPSAPYKTPASSWNTGSGGQQTISSSWTVQVWIYYANGGGGNIYNVIAILPAAASIGTLIAYENSARYFMQATVEPTMQLTAANNSVALVAHAPGSTTTGSVIENITVQMSVQTGGASQSFGANYSNGYTITDWYLTDQSNPGTATGDWLFYENTTWNPVTNPPSAFGDWWLQMYPSNDYVTTFPAASLKTYNCEAVAAWQVSGNPGNKGPLPTVLNMSVAQGIYGFANAGGNSGHHQITGTVITWSNSLNLDLIALT